MKINMLSYKTQMKVIGLMLILSLVGICGLVVAAESKPKENGAAEKPAQQKLVKVCTLGSVEANQEFQRNVQIMQAQRQHLIQLQNKLEQAQDKKEKKKLEKEIDEAMQKLNDDNKKMAKTYGFSLNRNYVMVVEKAHVYMAVSDEEAAKIESQKKSEAKKDKP